MSARHRTAGSPRAHVALHRSHRLGLWHCQPGGTLLSIARHPTHTVGGTSARSSRSQVAERVYGSGRPPRAGSSPRAWRTPADVVLGQQQLRRPGWPQPWPGVEAADHIIVPGHQLQQWRPVHGECDVVDAVAGQPIPRAQHQGHRPTGGGQPVDSSLARPTSRCAGRRPTPPRGRALPVRRGLLLEGWSESP